METDKAKNREFIAKIAKGGTNYIENVLKSYHQSELDNLKDIYSEEELELEMKELEKEGFSPYQILRFCNDHKIRCFGFDWKMRQFITNKNSDIKFIRRLPAFVFYFNDSHIYLIKDPKIRNALLQGSSMSELISLLSLEAKKETKVREHKVDIPFEQWGEGEKLNIHITKNREVNDQFYKLKDNIKNDLKDLIDFQMKNIYVQSVEILDVIANKDVIQSDIYKWTGTEQFEGDIKYFKAWNSNFNYHNFNLDINNEIPFECVPNALIISYGNRQSKK